MIYQIISFLLITQFSNSYTYYLKQQDFDNGPFIIKRSGSYILTENIIFKPPLEIPPYSALEYPQFKIGYFAAIIIQTKQVVLNFNNHTIEQSKQHYLRQRFYAHIELGSAPFIASQGPQDFVDNFQIAEDVIIKNGVLGLSSHHGIHGNNCKNIKIINMKIKDFEVGGISINGGKQVEVINTNVGPSFNMVMVSGDLSSAINILGFVKTILKGKSCFDEYPYIKINGQYKSVDQIYHDLKNIIDTTEQHFLNEQYDQIPELFKNISCFPNGSSQYGIKFHKENKSSGPFVPEDEENNTSHDIIIRNVQIHDLTLQVNERIALQLEDQDPNEPIMNGQLDSVGSSFHILQSTDKDGNYLSNPLSDAQLLVNKYKQEVIDNAEQFQEMGLILTDTSRDTISQEVLDWAADSDINKLYPQYVCNGDQMLHSIKGSIGLRLGGVTNVNVQNVQIYNIINHTDFGSQICGNYEDGFSLKNSLPGFLGNQIRGISVESCDNVTFNNVKAQCLESDTGSVYGIDVMFESSNVTGKINIGGLKTIGFKDLPKGFSNIPQQIPQCTPVNIMLESSADLQIDVHNSNMMQSNINSPLNQ